MSGSERGVRMTGEESVKQDYERDRLVGWTTSEEVRGSTGKSHDQEYMHKLIRL